MRGPGTDVAARIAEAGRLRADGESCAGPEAHGEADSPRRGGVGRPRDAARAPREPTLTTALDTRPPDTGPEVRADSTGQRGEPLTAAATDTRPGTRPPGPGTTAQADSPRPQTDSTGQRRKPLTATATDTHPGTRPPGPGTTAQADSPRPQTDSTGQRRKPLTATAIHTRPGAWPHATDAPSHDGTWSADPYAQALRTGQGPLFLRRSDGWLLLLELERWCAAADAADLEVLRRCEGAVLDVGCGPGRLVAALGARGRRVLGIDVSEAAVARTVALGGQALRRSVFETVPGEGRWGTALLIDGNVGIGGDPPALLDRMSQLLAPGGLLIAETVTDPDIDERVQVRVTDARGATGNPFPWARLGSPALLRHAARSDWAPVDQWAAGGRSFVSLRRRTTKTTAEPPNSTAVTSSQRARKPSGDRPVAEA
ncbi:SAM-dependent methyltransferase [Streptomyces sp. SAI-144]|nr:SAM-dependent methyltransferase [Streptomyces sp. SAI-144]